MACLVVMLPPSAIIFAVFNKYFSVGGIGGSTRWALTSSVDQKGQPECRENIKIGPNPLPWVLTPAGFDLSVPVLRTAFW
jgi:hypothetical protein